MRPILSYQKHREDFYGISRPEKGFYVNVYLYNIGSDHEAHEIGNLWPNRSEARKSAKEQVDGRPNAKCVYRIRVKPKVPIPDRPPPVPIQSYGFISPHPSFYPPCPCMAKHMRFSR